MTKVFERLARAVEESCWMLLSLTRQRSWPELELPEGIRHVREDELPMLIARSAEAYYQEPLMRYQLCADLFPKSDARLFEETGRLFEVALRLMCWPYSGVLIDEEQKATLWATPPGVRIRIWQYILIFPAIMNIVGWSWSGMKRFIRIAEGVEKNHKQWKNEDTIHIANLLRLQPGGDGAVRKLLRPFKALGRRIILEAEDPENVSGYEGEGFVTMCDIDVGDPDIFYVFMVRPSDAEAEQDIFQMQH